MNLIIVESPTKARTLGRFLGKDFQVEATVGHIKDLPKSKLGVDLEKNFEPDYSVVPKQKKTIKSLKDSAQKAETVFLATDPDREGEAIAKHVEEILKNSKSKKLTKSQIKRIVFHEITKQAVEHAIKDPRGIDENLVDAQIGRRVLDRLVGYKLSPLLWKKVRRGLSAGRVQSVALRLIVEKEAEREAFTPVEYWEIFCDIKPKTASAKDQFRVGLLKINSKKAEVPDKKTADTVVGHLERANYEVADVVKKEVKKSPYPPFTTSTMTQTAARFFSWSSKKTMTVAQRLYEEGLITYHRTDSTNLSKQAVAKVRDFIGKEYGKDYLPEKPRFFKTKAKVAQEAHEAIRPTNLLEEFSLQNKKFQKDGKKLYDLIWRRFVACQMAAAVFDSTRIDVLAQSNNFSDNYILRATGQIMKFAGWREVIPLSKDEDPQLPDVQKSDVLNLLKVVSDQKFTKPPARYNEASLIKTLEKMGIGRPSTYASIISTIQTRAYVEKQDGRFVPTSVGNAVNTFLTKNFDKVMDYSFTAQMEDNLDSVAKGEEDWQKMMKDFWDPFNKKLEDVEENAKRVKIEVEKLGKKCPECKEGELVIRTGRFGKFISCSRFPDCKHTEKYLEKIGLKCPDCEKGEVIVKRTRKGRTFYGCSRYPNCKYASWKDPRRENKTSQGEKS